MRYHQKNDKEKTILVLSDLHIGAGQFIAGRKNPLEDFFSDRELVEFFQYYSTGDYSDSDVEIVLNGDIFDLLTVPFVEYFDDEYWSEEAALDKLKKILSAHRSVVDAMVQFLSGDNKYIVYMIGNHDSEMIFPKLQKYLLSFFADSSVPRFRFINFHRDYCPIDGVVIKHGDDFDIACQNDEEFLISDDENRSYLLPSWGSYYVARIMNKFREERRYIHAVKPLYRFIINGLIYDTLFTLRFFIANLYYFFMVRFIFIFKQERRLRRILEHIHREIKLFQDHDSLIDEYIQDHPEVKLLIIGHTHRPGSHILPNGTHFINTGTWMRMFHLDFENRNEDLLLSYASILIAKDKTYESALQIWEGLDTAPYYRL